MAEVIGVRFKKAGKVYYFDPKGIEFAVGDGAIVETVRGVEFGNVVIAPRQVSDKEITKPLKQVLRKATEKARKSIIEESEANSKERKKYDEVMGDVKAIIEGVTDVDTANQALSLISDLEHALTSKKESGAMLTDKAKTLGLKYDSKAKAYVVKDGGKQ